MEKKRRCLVHRTKSAWGDGISNYNAKREIPGILSFSHPGYHAPREFYSPQYDVKELEVIPDRRITLYWNPSLIIEKVKATEFSFYTSDESATYDIIVEGIDKKGFPVYKADKLTVK